MLIFLPRMMFIKECSKLLLFAIIFTGKIYYSEVYWYRYLDVRARMTREIEILCVLIRKFHSEFHNDLRFMFLVSRHCRNVRLENVSKHRSALAICNSNRFIAVYFISERNSINVVFVLISIIFMTIFCIHISKCDMKNIILSLRYSIPACLVSV